MENIEIKVLEDKLSQWNLLREPWYQFYAHLPMGKMITAFRDPRNKEALSQILYENFKADPDSPCIMAWDKSKQQAVGLIQCQNLYGQQPSGQGGISLKPWAHHTWDEETISKWRIMREFLDMVFEKANVTEKFGTDKTLLMNILSVNPEYKKRGIGSAMIARTLEVARERGYSLVVAEVVNEFLQPLFIHRFGFTSLAEVEYRGNYGNYAEMPEEVKRVHTKAMVLCKKLFKSSL